jgi:hypothetical protein
MLSSLSVAYMSFKNAELACKCKDSLDQTYVYVTCELLCRNKILIYMSREINGKKCVITFANPQQGNPFRIVPKGMSLVFQSPIAEFNIEWTEPVPKPQRMMQQQQNMMPPQNRYPQGQGMGMGGNFPRPFRGGMMGGGPGYGGYQSYPNQRPRGGMMGMGPVRPQMGRGGYMQGPPGGEVSNQVTIECRSVFLTC